MNKKLLATLLIAVTTMATLTGCSTNAKSTGDDEIYKVTMAYIGDEYPDEPKVLEEINKILREDINMELDLVALNWGSYTNELMLMLSGNEKLDIIPIIVQNSAGYVNSGQVVDLTDLIDQYGTNIKEHIAEEFLHTPNIDGFVYGVTTKREWITEIGIMMRTDILEEVGFTEADINSLDDLDKVYEAVYAKYPTMTMLGGSQGGTPGFRWEVTDPLTDNFGALMDKGQSLEVVNPYETDEFVEFAEKMYEWNQKGYISKDCATTTEPVFSQVQAGKTFSYFTPLKAGGVQENEISTGRKLSAAPLFGAPYITSYSINFNSWGIAQNSQNKEKAFQCLDYIYGSPEIMNLINWGIEGEHYVYVDKENNIIGYPEGVDISNKTYGLNIGWELPNQFIAAIWEGNEPDVWEQTQKDIDRATRSLALGFTYDTSAVANELTALSNVKNEYFDAIGSGSADPSDILPRFNEALKRAGLETVMAHKQQQLDEWLADK